MKSLIAIKLHQTRFFPSFLIFRKKSEFDDQLKCVKLFIKLASLMEFDEEFDTFAHGFTRATFVKKVPLPIVGSRILF